MANEAPVVKSSTPQALNAIRLKDDVVPLRFLGLVAVIVTALALGVSAAHAGDDPCAEPNDSGGSACALNQDAEVQGFLSVSDDVDLFAINVTGKGDLRVDMTPPGDYRVGLLRADGSEVVKPQGEGVAARQFRVANISAGKYLIQVSSGSGDASPDLAYKVSFTLEPIGSLEGTKELVQARPQDLILRLDEAGKQAVLGKTTEGSTATGPWYQVEYNRQRTRTTEHSGALNIVQRVVVSPDVDTAKKAFKELSAQDFPEATAKHKGMFVPTVDPIGDEFSMVGSCTVDACAEKEPDVHHRVVFRVMNCVMVVYTFGYGGDGGGTTDNARLLAEMAYRHLL